MNPDCGFTWKAQMAIVYGLSPSAIPNPQVDIPMAPPSVTRKTYFPPPPGYDPSTTDLFHRDAPPDPAPCPLHPSPTTTPRISPTPFPLLFSCPPPLFSYILTRFCYVQLIYFII